jgi:hypothetical protein
MASFAAFVSAAVRAVPEDCAPAPPLDPAAVAAVPMGAASVGVPVTSGLSTASRCWYARLRAARAAVMSVVPPCRAARL